MFLDSGANKLLQLHFTWPLDLEAWELVASLSLAFYFFEIELLFYHKSMLKSVDFH